MAVDIREGTLIGSEVPYELFDTGMIITNDTQYGVAPDGQRFLFLKPFAEDNPTPITVLLDWTELLDK